MNEADKPEFVAALTELAALKPGAKLTPESYVAWWNAMQPWDIVDFCDACARLRDSMEFMPNPYHFEQLRKAGRTTSGEAWAEVLRIVRSGEFRQANGQSTNPLIRATVRAIGGYEAVAMSNTGSTHFLEKRFAEHFESITDAEDTREAVPQLAGPSRLGDITKLLSELT